MTTSLSNIRPGDKVILRNSSPYSLNKVVTVDRITKTQIIIGLQRFRISDGDQLGSRGQWSYCWITTATPDEIAEVERQQQLRQEQEHVYQLTRQVKLAARNCSNVAAAIPHLEAALVALKQENNND